MSKQNQTIRSTAAVREEVQLKHRDDFDTDHISGKLHEIASDNPMTVSGYIAELREISTKLYPWMPAHILDTVHDSVTDQVSNEEAPTLAETATAYCEALQQEYDTWVAEEHANAQEMYAAEADMEELFSVVSPPRTPTLSTDEHDAVKELIDRAQRDYYPDRRVEIVLEQAEQASAE